MYGASTKAQRLQAREAIFQAARESGAIVTEHADADCISIVDCTSSGHWVRVYNGTAAKPALNVEYRQADRAREALAQHVRNRAERLAQGAGGRRLSDAAITAAAIRKELARLFPGVKFSVRSDNFSMGDSVDVSWTDGPIQSLVEPVIHRYEWGTFDGMTDSSGVRELDPAIGCPGARFVQANRHMSGEHRAAITAAAVVAYGELPSEQYSVYHNGTFEPRLYEERHPELWPDAYRAMHAQQQEAQRAEDQRRAELCAGAHQAPPVASEPSAVTVVSMPPEPAPLRLVDPSPDQLFALLSSGSTATNVVSLADYRARNGR